MDLIDTLSTVSEIDRATFEQQWQQWRAARENNLASRHGFLAVTVSLDPPDEQGNVTLDFNRALNLPSVRSHRRRTGCRSPSKPARRSRTRAGLLNAPRETFP